MLPLFIFSKPHSSTHTIAQCTTVVIKYVWPLACNNALKLIKKVNVNFKRTQNASLLHQSRVHICLKAGREWSQCSVQAGGASQAGASDDGVDRAHTREGEVWFTCLGSPTYNSSTSETEQWLCSSFYILPTSLTNVPVWTWTVDNRKISMHIKVETFPLQGQMWVKDLRNIFHSDLLMRLAGVVGGDDDRCRCWTSPYPILRISRSPW